jgi:hypothetical protein
MAHQTSEWCSTVAALVQLLHSQLNSYPRWSWSKFRYTIIAKTTCFQILWCNITCYTLLLCHNPYFVSFDTNILVWRKGFFCGLTKKASYRVDYTLLIYRICVSLILYCWECWDLQFIPYMLQHVCLCTLITVWQCFGRFLSAATKYSFTSYIIIGLSSSSKNNKHFWTMAMS